MELFASEPKLPLNNDIKFVWAELYLLRQVLNDVDTIFIFKKIEEVDIAHQNIKADVNFCEPSSQVVWSRKCLFQMKGLNGEHFVIIYFDRINSYNINNNK